MNWWREFADRIRHDVPAGRQTWFRMGGPVRHLARPRDAEDLAAIVRRASAEGVPVKVLGAGANVLISDDGFDGLVVRLDAAPFRQIRRDGNTIVAGAGVDLMRLLKWCCGKGLAGLEGLAGIPASIGGGVCMNAGGRFGSFSDVVSRVWLIGDEGEVEGWDRSRLGFGYRGTNIGRRIVLAAELELVEEDPQRTRRHYEQCLGFKQRSQPLAQRTAGCVFKNPGEQSAGAIIDRAELKGASVGQARVSRRHANFIEAHPGATATDVLRLIDVVRKTVRQRSGIELELEIDVWRPARVRECAA
ncbi:MAG: UDP-N-acetylmuramate dehydrogenase [Phycisphaerae bacterium]